MASIAQSVLELMGRTPMVRLERVGAGMPAPVVAKLEWLTPGGSDKDRVALKIVEQAEQEGLLDHETTIVEPTSGNIGISLAIVCALRGYRLILIMPEFVPQWRVKLLRALGAEVVLTPASRGMVGAVERAKELMAALPRAFSPAQFDNPANPEAHAHTADEIWAATGGHLSAIVASVATGGTISGIGRRLKARTPDLLVVAVQPAESPVLTGGTPGAHTILGMGPPFVPGVYDEQVVDQVVSVSEREAYQTIRRLLREEGLLTGPAGGAAVAGALRVARDMAPGADPVVVILPDALERYAETEVLDRLQPHPSRFGRT
ncbi:MAG: cysteine synthase family protein [Ardenticatenia bacterium]|nr:cysteine synthase family protein [Ardenticatenia bacterium]